MYLFHSLFCLVMPLLQLLAIFFFWKMPSTTSFCCSSVHYVTDTLNCVCVCIPIQCQSESSARPRLGWSVYPTWCQSRDIKPYHTSMSRSTADLSSVSFIPLTDWAMGEVRWKVWKIGTLCTSMSEPISTASGIGRADRREEEC